MRRGAVWTMSVVTAAVVALSVPTVGRPAAEPRSVDVRPAVPRTTAKATQKPSTPPPAKPARSRAGSEAVRSVNGDLVTTAYGPVRVRITVQGGRVTRAQAVVHPQGDGTTDQINGYAVPVLNRAAVAAQSARVDTVSGATYTSEGYRQSLQSALDAAHRAGAL